VKEIPNAELVRIGRAAAEEVAGPGAVEDVEVYAGVSSIDRPAYYFTFLLDQDRARQRPGVIIAELVHRITDELHERDDDSFPFIRLLDRTDWPRRLVARPYSVAGGHAATCRG
jgi:hypothetical protein